MTVWELAACADGVRKANSTEETIEPMSPDAFEQLKQDAARLH